MPGATEAVTTTGIERLMREMDARILRLTGPQKRQYLTAVGKAMAENRRRRFLEEAGPKGAWAPLKESTQRGFLRPEPPSGRRGLKVDAATRKKLGSRRVGKALNRAFRAVRAAGLNKDKFNRAARSLALDLGISETKARATLRERRGAGHILRRTGKLMKSITSKIEGDSVLIGTNRKPAGFHQSGTSRMIARPIFGFTARDRRVIADLRRKYIRFVMEGR